MSKTTINPEALKEMFVRFMQTQAYPTGWDSLIKEAFHQKKEPKWKPKIGDLYWFISEGGMIFPQTFTNDPRDQGRLEFDNFFSTRELAEKRKAQWIALANEEESV